MSTWKKYGGIDKFDKTNHMTVDSMVANYFTIRKQIIGDIDISGNLVVRTRLDVYDDASFNQDMTVSGSVDIGDNLDVSGNITTNSNLTVKDNILVYHNLYFNSDRKVFMNGTPDGIGVNTTMPISQFDINSDLESVFSVKTSQPSTENVIARNNADKGIVVKSDLSSATIDFFCDSSMISSTFPFIDASGLPQLDVNLNYNNYDARIQAINDGSLTIDASSNIQLLAETIITDNKSSILDNNSSLSVYNDKTSNVYLEDIYDNTAAYVSDGISLVSVDETSSIFMKMVSRSTNITTKGFAIVGGAFAGDTSRAMGSLGCLDDDGNYMPNQTIVSGNSNVKIKTTLGINKYVPDVDTRVLDINGPIRVNNGEITNVKTTAIECNFLSFCRDNVNYGISTGAPYATFSDTDYADEKYWEAQIYYTSDAGMTWSNSSAKVYGTTSAKSINTGFVYDQSYAFVYGDDGIGFYTIDGGINWLNKSFNATSSDVKSMYIAKDIGSADCRFFMTYDGLSLRYYDAKIGSTSTTYVSYDGSSGSIVLNNTSGYTINSISFNNNESMNTVHGYGSYIYCAGSNIYKYDASSTTFESDDYMYKYTPSSDTYSYNTIYAYDENYVVAAGENIISYTLDGGNVWNDIIFTTSNDANVDNINVIYSENNESFQSIHVYDGSNAIVVGTNSSMYYTNNGTIWRKVPDNLLDSAGNRAICYGNSDVKLNGVYCINKNSFITTRTVEEYNGFNNQGSSKILYNYFPNLFNRSENMVLDMCGNMNIFGDINIQDNGNITSNGTTFYLVNDSVQDIYFGGDASNIEIGYTSGSTTIHHNLYVDKDLTVVDGNVYIPNKAYINLADISGLNVYEDTNIDNILTVGSRVVIENNAAITADDTSNAPLYVAGGSHFGGNVIMSNSDSLLYVNGTTRLMGNLYAMNNVYLESTSTTDEYTVQVKNGNVFLNNHMDISGNLEVMTNLFSYNNTHLGGNTYISGNVIYENVEISYEDVTISDNTTYNPSIINFYVEDWDNLQKPVSMATRAYVDASLNAKATIASPIFTGIPSAPTPSVDVSSSQIATTAFVKNQSYLKSVTAASTYAPIYNPDLSGIPTAPTASISTNTTQIATTEFVKNVIADISESITLTTLDNIWTGSNSFNEDIYVHGIQFGTMDGSSIVIGNNSLSSLTSGTNNIAVGSDSLVSTTSGRNNIAVGSYNGTNITSGSTNTIMGYQSLFNNTTGGNNVAMGTAALYNNKDGSYNIAIGYNAGYSDTSGSYNTYLGVNTNTTGNFSYSTAIGYGANISANKQIALGTLNDYVHIPSVTSSTSKITGALVVGGGVGIYGNVNVGQNIGISGTTRSMSTTTGALVVAGGVGISGNVYIGGNVDISGNAYATTASSTENSRMVATTAYVQNVFTGLLSSDNTWSGTNNFSKNINANSVVIGKYGSNNYVIGTEMTRWESGTYNTVFGANSMGNITNGSDNIGIGYQSLYSIDTGSNNIGVGNYALNESFDNNNNSALGYSALNTTVGSNNSALGSYAGNNNTTGVNNTYIGYNTGASSYNFSYSTALGQGATISGNNQIVLGTSGEYVSIPGTTPSTSSISGALVVSGGVGISGNVYVGGNLYAPTPASTNNSTQVATTAFVQTAITNIAFSTSGNYTWTGTNTFSQTLNANGNIVMTGNINNVAIKYSESNANFSLGQKSLSSTTSGQQNTAVGYNVLGNCTTGHENTGLGLEALRYCTTGSYHTSIGLHSLENVIDGNHCTAVGYGALQLDTSSNNTAIGSYSGIFNTTGSNNTFIGYATRNAGNLSYSTALGYNSTISEDHQIVLGTSGEYVSIPGTKVSTSTTSGALVVSGGAGISGNVYVGGNIYLSNTISTSDNSNMVATTAFVQSLVTSSGSTTTSSNNTWTGTNVFSQNITVNNIVVGTYGNSKNNYSLGTTFGNITSGYFNIGIGCQTGMSKIANGSNNIGIGTYSHLNNVSGSNNTGIGTSTLSALGGSAINNCVAVGFNSLNITTNDNNTAIGTYSGYLNTSGTYNSFLGYYAKTSGSGTYSYSTAIGQNATITANNQIVLGTSSEYVYIPSTTDATGSTGALVVSGGISVAKALYVSGNISVAGNVITATKITNSTDSTNTGTGALVVSGGAGILGNVYVGGNISTNGAVIAKYGNNNYGFGSLISSSMSGSNNINIGNSLTSITSASYNTVVGASSVTAVTTGTANTALGVESLNSITTSNYNSAIGYRSGYGSTGSYNTYLGSITSNTSGYSYSTCIGQNSSISASNQIVLGTTSEYVYIPGTKSSTSTSTGALVVSGGAGITGNVYVGGSINVGYTSLPTFGNSSIGTKQSFSTTSSTILTTSWKTLLTIGTLPAGVWHVVISFYTTQDTDANGFINYFGLTQNNNTPDTYERSDKYLFYNDTGTGIYDKITDVITQSTSGTDWYFVSKASESSQSTISDINAYFYRIA